jgi:hypothetical protein
MRQPRSWPWADHMVGLLEIVANHAARDSPLHVTAAGAARVSLALDAVVNSRAPQVSALGPHQRHSVWRMELEAYSLFQIAGDPTRSTTRSALPGGASRRQTSNMASD